MIFALLIIFFISPTQALEFEKAEVVFSNGKKLTVEIADDHEKRTQGLMYRTSLGENEGMLFIFDFAQNLSFWTKNTYVPLSIGYFDKDKKLQETYEMKPQSMMEKVQDVTSYPSHCRCLYALEVNKGWFKKNKIKKADSFALNPKSRKNPPTQKK